MNNPESQTPAPNDFQDNLGQLRAECDSLRHLTISMLILLIIVSGTLSIFLLRQYRNSQDELLQAQQQISAVMPQYQKVKPAWDDIDRKLAEYAKSHPDFNDIAIKYGLKQPAPSTGKAAPQASPSKK
jgi:hypothetical protein